MTTKGAKPKPTGRKRAPTQSHVVDESIRLAQNSNKLQVWALVVSMLSLVVTSILTVWVVKYTTFRDTARLSVRGRLQYQSQTDKWTTVISVLNLGPTPANEIMVHVSYMTDDAGNPPIKYEIDPRSVVVCCITPTPNIRFDEVLGEEGIAPVSLRVGEDIKIYADFLIPPLLNSTLQHEWSTGRWLVPDNAVLNRYFFSDAEFVVGISGSRFNIIDHNIPVQTLGGE